MKKTYFEAVIEFLDEDDNVTDFNSINQFDTYEEAVAFASGIPLQEGEQSVIYETEEETLTLVDSWVISKFQSVK